MGSVRQRRVNFRHIDDSVTKTCRERTCGKFHVLILSARSIPGVCVFRVRRSASC